MVEISCSWHVSEQIPSSLDLFSNMPGTIGFVKKICRGQRDLFQNLLWTICFGHMSWYNWITNTPTRYSDVDGFVLDKGKFEIWKRKMEPPSKEMTFSEFSINFCWLLFRSTSHYIYVRKRIKVNLEQNISLKSMERLQKEVTYLSWKKRLGLRRFLRALAFSRTTYFFWYCVYVNFSSKSYYVSAHKWSICEFGY